MEFDFNKEHRLENDRVLLRPLRIGDKEHLLPFSLHEPETWTYSVNGAGGAIALGNYLDFALKSRGEETAYPFIVYDKKEGAYAGSTRFYEISNHHSSLFIGYTWYGKNFRGTGLNKHCKYLLLKFAFETLEAERVGFHADNDNARSIAAMKSIGAKVEGVMRSHKLTSSGKRRDTIFLSILREEWFAGVKENLEKNLK